MRDYQARAVDRLFKKNVSSLRRNLSKLVQTTSYYTGDENEIWQELCILWYQNFEEYYETDRQYLSFLFICLKNRIRNMQKKQYTREGRYSSDLTMLCSSSNIYLKEESMNYQSVWGQVKDPSSHWDEYEVNELIQNSRKLLDNVGAKVFDAMMNESTISNDVNELVALKRRKSLQPHEKRRLNILQNKTYVEGLETSEVISIIKKQIRPLFEAKKISRSL